MSLIRRAASAYTEQRGANPLAEFGSSVPLSNGQLGSHVAGIPVTEKSAVQIAAVYGAVGLLADSVAGLPTLYLNGPDIATAKPVKGGSPLLDQPYSELSRQDWWRQFIWGLALHGNFLGQIVERDADLYPVQIKPIHPDKVQLRRNQQTGALEYRFYGKLIPLQDVFHVRYQSMPGMVIGLNPIEVCALAFGLSLAQDRYAEGFFINGADPRGVIQVPGVLDVNEAKAMLRSWLSAHQGLNSAHLPAVLTEGAEFKPITISPHDSQLLEALGFSEERIVGRIFRVSPHLLGMQEKQTSFGKGIESMTRGFTDFTLAPYYSVGAEALTAISPPGRYVVFDLRELQAPTMLERAQIGSLGMLAGYMLPDDARKLLGLAPLPNGEGQHLTMPINSQLLQQVLDQIAAGQAADNAPDPSQNGNGNGQ